MDLDGVKITWLGHATFVLTTPEGKRLLIDPWLAGNPKCPAEHHGATADAILCTHGHFDHIGDLLDAARRTTGPLVSIFELGAWAAGRGVAEERLQQMNLGGTIALDGLGVTVTMTDARHSSAWVEEGGKVTYLGEPAGYVVGFSSGLKVYHAGDTSLFGDMALIRELHAPDVAILPIGDRFTMDPRAAARAARLLGVKAVVPCHFGTFPLLTGTPAGLKEALAAEGLDVEMIALEPGQTAG